MPLSKCTNTSVRKLNLRNYNHYFNEDECTALALSHLGIQCEVLSIRVANGENIFHIVKNMLNLRALVVKCADDGYYEQSILINDNDELVKWLKDHLPSTYLIARDSDEDNNIVIWM